MALLCSHSVLVTLCAAHRALTWVVARTHYAVEPSRKCITFLMTPLPTSKSEVALLICRWLQRFACGTAIGTHLFKSIMTVFTSIGARTGATTGIYCSMWAPSHLRVGGEGRGCSSILVRPVAASRSVLCRCTTMVMLPPFLVHSRHVPETFFAKGA